MGYGAELSRYYDLDWQAIGMPREDVRFYTELAQETEGPLAEIGAGTGRVLLPVARAVERLVYAVEPSSPMRAALCARLAREAPGVRARVAVAAGGFEAIPLPDASVGYLFSAFRAFGHLLDPAAQARSLAEVRRVLRPGGTLAMDLFDPDPELLTSTEPLEMYAIETPQGHLRRRLDARAWDPEARVITVSFRWVETTPEGAVLADERGAYQVRATSAEELEALLGAAGFVERTLYGDFDRSPRDASPRELVVIAR